MILASAIPEISLGATKFKMGHTTVTMTHLRAIFIHMLGVDIS